MSLGDSEPLAERDRFKKPFNCHNPQKAAKEKPPTCNQKNNSPQLHA
jgi:hypothetical protein